VYTGLKIAAIAHLKTRIICGAVWFTRLDAAISRRDMVQCG
jgi:hypothetical protein